jgi:hypothetical protein
MRFSSAPARERGIRPLSKIPKGWTLPSRTSSTQRSTSLDRQTVWNHGSYFGFVRASRTSQQALRRQQLPHRNTKLPSEVCKRCQRGKNLSQFYRANVGTREIGRPQLRLAQTSRQPQLPNAFANDRLQAVARRANPLLASKLSHWPNSLMSSCQSVPLVVYRTTREVRHETAHPSTGCCLDANPCRCGVRCRRDGRNATWMLLTKRRRSKMLRLLSLLLAVSSSAASISEVMKPILA